MVEDGIVRMMQEYVTLARAGASPQSEGLYWPAGRRQLASPCRRPAAEQPDRRPWPRHAGAGRHRAAETIRLSALPAGAARSDRSRMSTAITARTASTPFLARTDILICLLPLTEETRGVLDARLFAALPPARRSSMSAAAPNSIMMLSSRRSIAASVGRDYRRHRTGAAASRTSVSGGIPILFSRRISPA